MDGGSGSVTVSSRGDRRGNDVRKYAVPFSEYANMYDSGRFCGNTHRHRPRGRYRHR